MGDVAMTVPVVRAFVEQHPKVKITVVSRPFFAPFFDGIENVHFFEVDVKKRHKGFFGLLKLYSDLKKLNIDAIADLHNVLRSKIIRNLFALSGKKVAFTDKARAEKKALTQAKNKFFEPIKTVVNRHVETFNQLGFSINLKAPKFPPKAILSESILKISGEKNNKNWIGIAPFAQYESKVYPADLMQKVIDELALSQSYRTKNLLFLFGGGSKEMELLNSFANGKENVINTAGKLTFKEQLDLISNLEVILSMDSGNAHIAAMFGVNVVTLWGATHPFAGFLPFNQPIENCLVSDRKEYPKLPTSIYGNLKVAGYEDAMRTITAEKCIKKITSFLS